MPRTCGTTTTHPAAAPAGCSADAFLHWHKRCATGSLLQQTDTTVVAGASFHAVQFHSTPVVCPHRVYTLVKVTAAAGSLEGNLGKEAHTLRSALHCFSWLLAHCAPNITCHARSQEDRLDQFLGSDCSFCGFCHHPFFCRDIVNAGMH